MRSAGCKSDAPDSTTRQSIGSLRSRPQISAVSVVTTTSMASSANRDCTASTIAARRHREADPLARPRDIVGQLRNGPVDDLRRRNGLRDEADGARRSAGRANRPSRRCRSGCGASTDRPSAVEDAPAGHVGQEDVERHDRRPVFLDQRDRRRRCRTHEALEPCRRAASSSILRTPGRSRRSRSSGPPYGCRPIVIGLVH